MRLVGALKRWSFVCRYQWIDSPTVGGSAIVVTDGDLTEAQRLADRLASWVWDRKEQWCSSPSPDPATSLMAQRYFRYLCNLSWLS